MPPAPLTLALRARRSGTTRVVESAEPLHRLRTPRQRRRVKQVPRTSTIASLSLKSALLSGGLLDFCNARQFFSFGHSAGRFFCSDVANLQQHLFVGVSHARNSD